MVIDLFTPMTKHIFCFTGNIRAALVPADSYVQSIPKLNYILEAHLANTMPLPFHANANKGDQASPFKLCLEMTSAFSPYMRTNTFRYSHNQIV